MSKNANGEGSVYKRTRDGKVIGYAGALSYPDETGRTKRHTVYGRTRAEVRDKLKGARDRLDAGAPVKDASRTVGEWMRQWRETTLAVSDRKESTRDLYANLSRRHLETGAISTTRLDRLKPSDVEALVLAKRAETKVRDGETVRALSDSTFGSCTRCCEQDWTVLSVMGSWRRIRARRSSVREWRGRKRGTCPPVTCKRFSRPRKYRATFLPSF